MSDWVEGDDYGVVWLNPDGEQVGSDDDQLYNTPEGVELKQGYRWQGHWVVGEWEYGTINTDVDDWIPEAQAGWAHNRRRRIWIKAQVPEVHQ